MEKGSFKESSTIEEKEEEYETVGEIIKKARISKKLKIEEVADKIRIRAQYLEAIENGDFQDLPGATYASGFVRTYASFLGLDSNVIYDRFREEASGIGQKITLSVMEPEEEGSHPGRKEIVIAIVLFLIGYGLWSIFSSYEDETTLSETVDTSTVTEEVPVEISVKEDIIPSEKQSFSQEAPEISNIGTSVSEISEQGLKGEPLIEEERVSSDSSVDKASGAKEEDVSQPEATPSPSSRVVIIANSETWVQISKDRDNIVSRVLAKGDKYYVPEEEGLLLRTGNAGGLDIYVDGEKIAPIGPKGSIRSGVLLDAEALLLR